MHVRIYTDGACKGNPGPAGIAAVLLQIKDGAVKRSTEVSMHLGQSTNNVAEMKAVVLGINRLREPEKTDVTILTDSQLVVNFLEERWTPRTNLETVEEMRAAFKRCKSAKVQWVRGHDTDRFNRRADKLASQAALKKSVIRS
jgi:ribonuclease HI